MPGVFLGVLKKAACCGAFSRISSLFCRLRDKTSGASAVSYSLIIAGVSITALYAYSQLGDSLEGVFENATDETANYIDWYDDKLAGSSNPTISNISSIVLNIGESSGEIPFAVGDSRTPPNELILTAESDNQTIVPDSNISLGGAGEARTIIIAPQPTPGSAEITITVVDEDGNDVRERFTVTVNAPPTITAFNDLFLPAGVTAGPFDFTIDDPDGDVNFLILSASSSNETVLPADNITFSGSGGQRALTILPAAGLTGVSTVTISVNDGYHSTEEVFDVTVILDVHYMLTGSGGTILTSDDGMNWFTQTSGVTDTLAGLAYGEGRYVVAGASGTIVTSVNGKDWSTSTSGTTESLKEATYTGGQFVVVGGNGIILTSDDGQSWASQTSGVTDGLRSVIGGISQYVVVGDNGTILTSADSLSWTSRTSGTSHPLYSVHYASGQYVAVGGDLAGIILTSPDGITWTSQTSGISTAIVGVDYIDGLYVVTGNAGEILTSPDGVTWTSRTSGTALDLNRVGGDDDLLVTGGQSGTLLTSTDGITWASQTSGVTEDLAIDVLTPNLTGQNTSPTIRQIADSTILKDTVYGPVDVGIWDIETDLSSLSLSASSSDQAILPDGNIVLGGSGGTRTLTATPTAGQTGIVTITLTLDDGSTSVQDSFELAVVDKWFYVATGNNGEVVVSGNGTHWARRPANTSEDLRMSEYGGGQYFIGGFNGALETSSDAESWTVRTSGFGSSSVRDLAYYGGVHVIVGSSGKIATSYNGTSWTARTSGTSETLHSVDYALDQFVAVGGAGTIITSPDGINWTAQVSGVSEDLSDIFHGVDGYVVSGDLGVILTSADGQIWLRRTSGGPDKLAGVLYDGSTYFIAALLGDYFMTSVDTLIWSQVSTGLPNLLLGEGSYINGQYLYSGSDAQLNSVVLRSTDGSNWSVLYPAGAPNLLAAMVSIDPSNSAPTIFQIDDQATFVDVSKGPVNFTVGDLETDPGSLVVTAVSDNQTILPDANITLGGSGAQRTISMTPGAGQSGQVTITVTVDDGTDTVQTSFALDVIELHYVVVGYGEMLGGNETAQKWVPISGSWGVLVDVGEGNGIYMAVGTQGRVFTSSDGLNWTSKNPGTTETLRGIAYRDSDQTFMVVGDGATAYTTTDNGDNWTSRTFALGGNLTDAVYAEGQFFAVASDGTVYNNSGSGLWAWTSTASGAGNVWGLGYGGGTFVVHNINGSNFTIHTSDTGTSGWSQVAALGAGYGNTVKYPYAAGQFVAMGNTDHPLTSWDEGATWQDHQPILETNLAANGTFYGGGLYISVGDDGAIYVSSNGGLWEQYDTGSTQTLTDGIYVGPITNEKPVVEQLLDSAVLIDTSWGPTTFHVGDEETAAGSLSVSAVSSNQTVVPNGNITLGGSGENRTISITPAAGQTGIATITVTANDGTNDGVMIFEMYIVDKWNYLVVGDAGKILGSPNGSIWGEVTSGTSNNLYGVVYGGGKYIAVGQGGTVLSSADGSSWTTETSGVTASLYEVAYEGGQYMAVTGGNVLTSPDGVSWTLTSTSQSETFQGITYGQDQYVIIGSNGAIETSVDGQNWFIQDSGSTGTLRGISYGDGLYTMAAAGTEIMLSSPDAITWTDRTGSLASHAYETFYNGSNYLASVVNGRIYVSGDGITWTELTTGDADEFQAGASANGVNIVVGTTGTIYTSSDGLSWTKQITPITDDFEDVVAISEANTAPEISVTDWATLQDEASKPLTVRVWDEHTAGGSLNVSAVSDNQSLVQDSNIVIGGSHGMRTATITPETGQTGTATLTFTVSDGSLQAQKAITFTVVDKWPYVVAGWDEGIRTSADGAVWIDYSLGGSDDIYALEYGGGVYLAAGNGDRILTSPDGSNWTAQTTGTFAGRDVYYHQGLYIGVSVNGIIKTSTDTVNWTSQTSGTLETLQAITYGEGKFVTVGHNGTILTSSDAGVSWTAQTSGISGDFLGVAHGNDSFVAVTIASQIMSSPDAETWTERTDGTTTAHRDVIYDGSQFIVVSANSIILTSSDGISWSLNAVSGGNIHHFEDISEDNGTYLTAGGHNGAVHDEMYIGSDPLNMTKAQVMPSYTELKAALVVDSSDDSPVIDSLTDWAGLQGQPSAAQSFAVWDDLTKSSDLIITATSSNQTIVQDSSIVIGGSDRDRTLTVTPEIGQTGAVTISLTVDDGTNQTNQDITFTIVDRWPYVAAGEAGHIVASADGQVWIAQTSGTANDLWRGVVFGNGLFVANGDGATVLTSPDGATWTQKDPLGLHGKMFYEGKFYATTLNKVCVSEDWNSSTCLTTEDNVYYFDIAVSDSGTFVIVGEGGGIESSPDGTTWTARTSGETEDLNGVAYGNGIFVAGGGTGKILSSTNGTTWTSRTSGITDYIRGVYFDGTQFVVGASSGRLITSVDGINWTTTIYQDTAAFFYGYVNDAENVYLMLSEYLGVVTGDSYSTMAEATYQTGSFIDGGITYIGADTAPQFADLTDWATFQDTASDAQNFVVYDDRTAPASISVSAVSSNQSLVQDGNIVLGGAGRDRTLTITPETGQTGTVTITVTATDNAGLSTNQDITFHIVDKWVYVGVASAGKIIVSADGQVWLERNSTHANDLWRGLVHTGGKYVASGPGGVATVSADGETWTTHNIPGGNLYGKMTHEGKFYGVTKNRVYSSSDAENWSYVTTAEDVWYFAIAAGNDTFVIVGENGNLESSLDAITWTARTSGTTEDLNSVVFGNGIFVAGGANGTTLRSSDGINWTETNVGGTGYIRGATFDGTKFAVYSYDPFTSTDGINWTHHNYIGPDAFYYGYANDAADVYLINTLSRGLLIGTDAGTMSEVTYNPIEESVNGTYYAGVDGPPNLVDLTDWATLENTTSDAQDFVVYDDQTASTAITLLAVSSNQSLVQDGNIVLGGTNADRTLTITPETGQTGAVTITVTATDNAGLSTNQDITFTIVDRWPFMAAGDDEMLKVSADTNVWLDRDFGGAQTGVVQGAAYGVGTYIAVGSTGGFKSSDGETWTSTLPGVNLNDIVYASGVFMATAGNGWVHVSGDGGTSWQNYFTGSSEALRTIFYGDDVFLVGGENDRLRISYDHGQTWADVTPSGPNSTLYGSAFHDGLYVIGGATSTGLFTSTDTINWTDRTSELSGNIVGMVHDGSKYITVGDSYAGASYGVQSSSDGLNWTSYSNSRGALGSVGLRDIDHYGTSYVAVGADYTADDTVVARSADGINFTDAEVITGVKVGYLQDVLAIATADDAPEISFNQRHPIIDTYLGDHEIYGPRNFYISDDHTQSGSIGLTVTSSNTSVIPNGNIVVGGSHGIRTLTITPVATQTGTTTITIQADDGINAPAQYTFDITVVAVQQFASVGAGGLIITSDDGSSWTQRVASGASSTFRDIAYGSGRYLSVGVSNTLYVSEDGGVSWINRSAQIPVAHCYDVIHHNGLYTAVCQSGRIYTSTDTITWDEYDTGFTGILYGITRNPINGDYIVVGASSKIYYAKSTQNTWTEVNSGSNAMHSVVYGQADGRYVVVGDGGNTLYSSDGISWSSTFLQNTGTTRDVIHNGSDYLAVNYQTSNLYTSANGSTWSSSNVLGVGCRDILQAGSTYYVSCGGESIKSSTNLTVWTTEHNGPGDTLFGITWEEDY